MRLSESFDLLSNYPSWWLRLRRPPTPPPNCSGSGSSSGSGCASARRYPTPRLRVPHPRPQDPSPPTKAPQQLRMPVRNPKLALGKNGENLLAKITTSTLDPGHDAINKVDPPFVFVVPLHVTLFSERALQASHRTKYRTAQRGDYGLGILTHSDIGSILIVSIYLSLYVVQ